MNKNVRAIDLYDGGNFRILREYYPKLEGVIDVMIISAKYGLISPESKISYYNVTVNDLSNEEKKKLSDQITNNLKKFMENKIYNQVFLDLGKNYMELLENYDFYPIEVIREEGGIGMKLQRLKQFLEDKTKKGNLADFEISEYKEDDKI